MRGFDMKGRILMSAFLFMQFSSAYSQTERDLRNKYTSRTVYEIRPKVQLLADFSSKGEVCSVYFQPSHVSEVEKTQFLGNLTLDPQELLNMIDEIAPPATRRGTGESMGFITSGGMIFGAYKFENLRINVAGSMLPGKVGWKNNSRTGIHQPSDRALSSS